MTTAVEAVYEGGALRLLHPLAFPEHTRVKVTIEACPPDPADDERAIWLAQSERRLRAVWDNEPDDVFNELLTR